MQQSAQEVLKDIKQKKLAPIYLLHGDEPYLIDQLVDAFESKGSAVKKREETHKMAKANQAFAHFRWN